MEEIKKATWIERAKETWRATWPVQISSIIIMIVAIVNLGIMISKGRGSDDAMINGQINGLLVSSILILSGFNYLYYKDHYMNMAKKHKIPGYEKPIKYAKWQMAGGTILFILWIILFVSM